MTASPEMAKPPKCHRKKCAEEARVQGARRGSPPRYANFCSAKCAAWCGYVLTPSSRLLLMEPDDEDDLL